MIKKIPVYGFTSKANGLTKSLRSEIIISQAFNPSEDPTKRPCRNKYVAIWDTGATNTVITEKVVNECNLMPTGMITVETVSDTVDVETYMINAGLPNNVGISFLKVSKGKLKNVDVLIGMDIISKGDLAISNFQGKTVFAFRIPSIECIDFNPDAKYSLPFVAQSKVGRNDPCPCGSGKKFKKCCGK